MIEGSVISKFGVPLTGIVVTCREYDPGYSINRTCYNTGRSEGYRYMCLL